MTCNNLPQRCGLSQQTATHHAAACSPHSRTGERIRRVTVRQFGGLDKDNLTSKKKNNKEKKAKKNKPKENKQYKTELLITSKLIPSQPLSNSSPGKLPPGFLAEHSLVQHGISLWSLWASWPSCVPSQLPAGRAAWKQRDFDSVSMLLSTS